MQEIIDVELMCIDEVFFKEMDSAELSMREFESDVEEFGGSHNPLDYEITNHYSSESDRDSW